MAKMEQIDALLADINSLVDDSERSPSPTVLPKSLAEKLSEATGLPTAVTFSDHAGTAEQGAHMAAQLVLQRVVLPGIIGQHAGEAVRDIDDVLAVD